MNRIFTIIPLLVFASAAFAQESIKVGDMVDLEERVLYKKMADELSKPNPNAPPPPPPAIVIPKPPKVVHRTETLAVYGTTATFYEGQLSMGGTVYTVRNGTPVQDYVVTAVSPQGITLVKNVRGKGRSRNRSNDTLFAPLPAQ
jgi:hypothetical protein